MRVKSKITLWAITGFFLIHFGLEAGGSEIAAPTTELNGIPAKKNHSIRPKNGFSKGAQKWQAYGSAAAGDHGKGEMYSLHLGYAHFLWNYLSVNIDLLGAYIRSGIDDNGVAAGLDVTFRRHFSWVNDDRWTVYLDLGGGFQQQSTKFSGSRHFNFRVMGGGGGTLRVSDRVILMGGLRYLHISDAGIEGGGGGFDGFMFYGGAMFPF